MNWKRCHHLGSIGGGGRGVEVTFKESRSNEWIGGDEEERNDPAYVCVWVQLGQNKERSG